MAMTLSQSLSELPEYTQVLGNLVARDLKVKYQGKGLGFLWTLLHPAIHTGIWYVVFSLRVLRVDLYHYWAYLLAGILTFQFISTALIEGSFAIRKNSAIIRKVYVPMEILVIAAVTVKMVEFAIQLLVAVALLMIAHHSDPTVHISLQKTMIVLPGALLLLYLFVVGLSMPLAGYCVIYRDLDHVVALALNASFYLTPVFWVLHADQGRIVHWVWLNPFFDMIELMRGPLYWGDWPSNVSLGGGAIATWGVPMVFSFAALIFGYLLLGRVKHILAEVV
jgi:ABC-type polysaccharide/polyol phosphate export permease